MGNREPTKPRRGRKPNGGEAQWQRALEGYRGINRSTTPSLLDRCLAIYPFDVDGAPSAADMRTIERIAQQQLRCIHRRGHVGLCAYELPGGELRYWKREPDVYFTTEPSRHA